MTTEEYHRQAGMSEDYNRLRAEYAALDGKYKTATIVCEDLLRELDNISHVHWDDMTHEDFVHWARSRARFAIDQGERKLGRPGLYEKAQSSKTPSDVEFEKMKSDTYLHDSLKATLEPIVGDIRAHAAEAMKHGPRAREERESAIPLPCPFCGIDRIMVLSDSESEDIYCKCDPEAGGCGARSGPQGCSTVKAAIARWNKRA